MEKRDGYYFPDTTRDNNILYLTFNNKFFAGPRAYELLLEEKKRVSNRLSNLKQSITALNENGKRQTEKLKTATASLAEIEDMLKVS
jgi:hypothetical protein